MVDKQYERTGIKEFKNLKISNILVEQEKKRQLKIEREQNVAIVKGQAREKCRCMTAEDPFYQREIERVIRMLNEIKERAIEKLSFINVECDDVDNFFQLCDASIDYTMINKDNFNFISLRKYRHAIKKSLETAYRIYFGITISGSVDDMESGDEENEYEEDACLSLRRQR